MKQHEHTRRYKSGKRALVNQGNRQLRKSFFGFKKIPERWFIQHDIGAPQPTWHVKDVRDRNYTYFQLVEFQKYPSSPLGDADHDGVFNIFDRKPLSAQDRHTVPPTVKRGNRKLTEMIGIFSLPRFYTCPGKTPLCSRYCYAEPPERYRAAVVYSRNKNYIWTRRKDFIDVMSRMLKSLNLPYFRIHEAGDFYNQEYFEKWKIITERVPQTRFLAYTKNWKLDFSNMPKNFTIRYSSDISSQHLRKDISACYVGVERPTNFFLCKKKCEPGFCMACWNGNMDVYIPIHSVSKADVDEMFFKAFNPSIPKLLVSRRRLPLGNLQYKGRGA